MVLLVSSYAIPQRVKELETIWELYPGGDYAILYELGCLQYAYCRWPSRGP